MQKPVNMPTALNKVLAAIFMVVVSAVLILLFSHKSQNNDEYSNKAFSKDGFYFDTYISITIYDSKENHQQNSQDSADFESILDECMNICQKYQLILSCTDEDSELYKLNHSADYLDSGQMNISDELRDVIEKTVRYSEPFSERFSIFSGDLCQLWNYENKVIPTDSQIQTALKNEHPSITLGASAKGYIADKLTEYLKSQGINEAIIDLGGNIVALGDKYDNSMYKIGIKKPFSDSSEPIAVCKVAYKSVVTSGVYERYFEQDGKIYHHIIDMSTGYPADNGILSATIICGSSLMADCYSTGCVLFPVDFVLDLINKTSDVECILVDENYNIILSDGLTYDGDYIVLK